MAAGRPTKSTADHWLFQSYVRDGRLLLLLGLEILGHKSEPVGDDLRYPNLGIVVVPYGWWYYEGKPAEQRRHPLSIWRMLLRLDRAEVNLLLDRLETERGLCYSHKACKRIEWENHEGLEAAIKRASVLRAAGPECWARRKLRLGQLQARLMQRAFA